MAIDETNLRKFVGFGRIFIGATLPGDFGTPTIAAGTPAMGEDLGATIGAAEFAYNASIDTFKIEQTTLGIVPITQSEEMTATIRLAETDYTNLRYALSQTFARTVGGRTVLNLGGQIDVTGRSLTVVAEMPSNPGKYYGFMLYSAYPSGEIKIPIKRGDVTRVVEVKFMAAAVTARPTGDQLGQWFEDN